MKKKTLWIRVLMLFLAVLMLLGIAAPVFSASATTITELNRIYAQLQDEQAELQKQLNSTRNQKNQQVQYKNALEKQINITQEQISTINAQIEAYTAQIAQKQSEIESTQKDIDYNTEQLRSRLRAMYMSSDTSVLILLMESESFTDFLTASDTITRIYQRDKALISKMMEDKKTIEKAKQDLEADKASLQAKNTELAQTNSNLSSQKSESQRVISSLAGQEAAIQADIRQKQAEMANAQQEIQRYIASTSHITDYVGGAFLWPIAGYTKANITSYFGPRYINGVYDYHTGIDLSGYNAYGRPILAANSGMVKYVRYYSYGYGKHLLIDHGGGTYTLYAHTSSIIVQEGQWVTRGQVIGYVGSTGWSTGPHLHFEIWINSKQINPLNYF